MSLFDLLQGAVRRHAALKPLVDATADHARAGARIHADDGSGSGIDKSQHERYCKQSFV